MTSNISPWGLLIFFGLLFSAVLPNLGKTVAAPDPKLDTPAIQKLAAKDRKCVMPTDYMRANHMQMLVDWREYGGPQQGHRRRPGGRPDVRQSRGQEVSWPAFPIPAWIATRTRLNFAINATIMLR